MKNIMSEHNLLIMSRKGNIMNYPYEGDPFVAAIIFKEKGWVLVNIIPMSSKQYKMYKRTKQ